MGNKNIMTIRERMSKEYEQHELPLHSPIIPHKHTIADVKRQIREEGLIPSEGTIRIYIANLHIPDDHMTVKNAMNAAFLDDEKDKILGFEVEPTEELHREYVNLAPKVREHLLVKNPNIQEVYANVDHMLSSTYGYHVGYFPISSVFYCVILEREEYKKMSVFSTRDFSTYPPRVNLGDLTHGRLTGMIRVEYTYEKGIM